MKNRDGRLPAVGTVLTRPYKGQEIVIAFLEDGFEWRGVGEPVKFSSLSALARSVTGAASMNGYLWAGLDKIEVSPTVTVEAPKPAVVEKPKKAAPVKPVDPKIGGETNEIGTPDGQRAALREAGIV